MNQLAVFEVPDNQAVVLFADRAAYSDFYKRIKAETDKLVPDLSSSKGRDEIKAMAFKVTKAKTGLAAQALALTEDWRVKTAAVNDAKRVMIAELDDLAKEVRKPLSDWECAENSRVEKSQAAIDRFIKAGAISVEDTAATVRARGAALFAELIDAESFGDLHPRALVARNTSVEALKSALARITQEESDKAELELLRAAGAEREKQAAAKALAEQAEQEEAEQQRIAAEREQAVAKERADAIAKAEQAAAHQAALEAQQAAAAQQAQRDEDHAQALATERNRAIEAERIATELVEAAEKHELEARLAKEGFDAAELKRTADQAHRQKIKTAAKRAIITCGADDETASKIVLAVLANEIPHMKLEF